MKKVEVWKSTEPEVLEKMPFAQKYEGYVVDLIRALSKQVKFKYNMYIVEDGAEAKACSSSGSVFYRVCRNE